MIFFQILDIIVIICVFIPANIFKYYIQSTSEWAKCVSLSGLFITGILLSFYLLHIIEKFSKVPWIMIELGFCIIWSFFYLTVGLDLIVKGTKWAYTKNEEFLTFGTSFFCFLQGNLV